MGTNTIGVDIYTLGSRFASSEYGSRHSFINPSFETSTVTPVAVPDESFISFPGSDVSWRSRFGLALA